MQKVNHGTMKFNYENAKSVVKAPTREDVSWVCARLKKKWGAVPRPHHMTKRHQLGGSLSVPMFLFRSLCSLS